VQQRFEGLISPVKISTELRRAHFPHVFFAIFHSSLAPVFIY
jgi:hypothetical protein